MATKRFRAADGSHMCALFFCDRKRERHCCTYCEDRDKCRNKCMNNPEKCGEHFIQGESHDSIRTCKV